MPDFALPLSGIVTGPWWMVLIKCLIICPGMPILLAAVFESRWLPLRPQYQFLAFFPGNPFLAMFIAAASLAPPPATTDIWQSRGLSEVVLGLWFVMYVVLNVFDLASQYTTKQMASATKIYHNALYFWYGYLASMMAIYLLASSMSLPGKIAATLPGWFWVACLVKDTFFISEEEIAIKFKTAHTENCPLWVSRRFRRLDTLRLCYR